MTWNYRIMRHVDGDVTGYAIHEVYYDKNGNVNGWTENAIAPYADTQEEMQEVLDKMGRALSEDVLDYD